MTNVTSSQAQEQLSDWTVVDGRLEISVRAKDFVQAIEFVNRFTNLAEAQNHHPDFDIRYNTIRMRVVSHDVGGLTDRDINFATAVNVLIEEMGLKRQPEKITRATVVLVSANVEAIKPFWKAIFDFKDAKDDDHLLLDRSDVLPPLRFHELTGVSADDDDATPALGNVHFEIFVPASLTKDRRQAAVEAGGRLLSDANATDRWELADADGNRVILQTEG